MDILFHHKLVIKLKLARNLENVLLVVILSLSCFAMDHKGAIGVQGWCCPEGWSICQQTMRECPLMPALISNEQQRLIIVFYPCPP
jgi:hypothetical protein